MLHVKLITVGNLKEPYWREAAAEYQKRLSAFAKTEIVELKEARLSETPAPAEIAAALEKEADEILAAVPPRAFVTALCVEGEARSSEQLAALLGDTAARTSELCFIIGSSYGLADAVKQRADLRLSFSQMTFPHTLMRVVLAEQLYRAFTVIAGKTYHK